MSKPITNPKRVKKEQLVQFRKRENHRSKRELRFKLFNENPHCYWCGHLVINIVVQDRISPPWNMATLDHLFDRFDIENRYKEYPNNEDRVLACFKCNTERQKIILKRLGKDFLKKRAEILNKKPKGMPWPIFLQENNL